MSFKVRQRQRQEQKQEQEQIMGADEWWGRFYQVLFLSRFHGLRRKYSDWHTVYLGSGVAFSSFIACLKRDIDRCHQHRPMHQVVYDDLQYLLSLRVVS